jgi:hypothetical protein
MPLTDDNIQDLDPSSDPNLDETAKVADAAKPDDAKSSDATDETGESDLLSVVRDVVKDRKEEPKPAASSADGEEDEGSKEGAAKKPDDENYSDVPFNKHPRFQQLLRENKVHKQDAERYHNVVGFLQTAGLSDGEAADGLQIMGLAKTNPAEAWKQIKPWVQKLLVASGEVLPGDLRQRVTNGELSQEAAMEVSRARATVESTKAAQSFREQQEQRSQQTSLANGIRGAAHSWEQDRRMKDPNFDAKYEPLMKEVAWLIQKEGKPNTPEGVKDQLKRAYKTVNDTFAPPAPAAPARKPAVRPITGGQVAGNQRPSEMSTLDIIRANRKAG